MKGPFKPGTGIKPEWLRQHFLICNKQYRVIRAFVDTDGDTHPVGEEWLFVGSMINNYDSEVIFAVRRSNEAEWQFILGDDTDRQHEILAHISEYVKQI